MKLRKPFTARGCLKQNAGCHCQVHESALPFFTSPGSQSASVCSTMRPCGQLISNPQDSQLQTKLCHRPRFLTRANPEKVTEVLLTIFRGLWCGNWLPQGQLQAGFWLLGLQGKPGSPADMSRGSDSPVGSSGIRPTLTSVCSIPLPPGDRAGLCASESRQKPEAVV